MSPLSKPCLCLALIAALAPATTSAAQGRQPGPAAPATGGLQQLLYSVVAPGGQAMTVRISPLDAAVEATPDAPAPTAHVEIEPDQRFLAAPWPAAGVYAPPAHAISDAPELDRLPGPWTVSIDYN